jgi:2'-5' RNA ligase
MNQFRESQAQYFIAIIPPSPLYDEALRLKNYFRDQYNSKASLNSPPHITLHMPFLWKKTKENELIDQLHNFALTQTPFKLRLQNFGAFPPRVIFIDVMQHDLLTQLQQDLHRFCKRELNLFNAAYKNLPFHPHITLAFRDLKRPLFETAWQEFQERKFSASLDVDNFVLLKHNSKIWEILKTFSFREENENTTNPTSEMHH